MLTEKRLKIIVFSFLFFTSLSQNLFAQNDFYSTKNTDNTEISLKQHFDNNSIDPIEGIYKTSGGVYYKIAIKKYDDLRYLAIIIDSEDKKRWKEGAVKAYIEKSASEDIFSIRYLMGDKSPVETTCVLKYKTLLSLWIPTGAYGTKEETLWLKMYPLNKTESNRNITNNTLFSGSGFFINTKGLIATNAHVVNSAKKIEIKTSNDFGSITYNAKLILIDIKNDVAIIQIDDPSFKELTALPYGISENAEIGEKVFTIGYPLNDVMGNNFKVADGIVSSKSGISDDLRYYQISVPIQPGNSGGPLFNSQGNIIGITSARLNSKAVGVQIENVNYAIKSTYLSSLITMLPMANSLPPTGLLNHKDLKDQIKILKDYVCLIIVSE